MTTSSPCIEVVPKRVGFYGAHFYARKKFIPISHRLVASLEDPFTSGKMVKRKVVDDLTVKRLNIQQVNWSTSTTELFARCYSPRTKELVELVDSYYKHGDGALLPMAIKQIL